MLSAQSDELRERAKVLRQGDWSDGAEDAKMMDDAADTILSLRDRAQDLQAENAKLREMCRDLVGELRGLGIDFTRVTWCEYADELRELGVEVDA